MELISKIIKGDHQALARAISLVESRSVAAIKLLEKVYPYVGKAYRIGITGPPGVGKSTLTNELGKCIRQKHQTLGVIAIDPSSIFSGGAILGDRIRMQKIEGDQDTFIRSMATRGSLGGIAHATTEASDLLDASGKNYIIIETVGVGQSEIDIFKNVDLTMVVLSPESGDAIQMMKSGLIEIADIIVVNKADRPQADSLVSSLQNIMEISAENLAGKGKKDFLGKRRSQPLSILKTEAINSIGIKELFEDLEGRLSSLDQSGELKEKRQQALLNRLKSLISTRLEEEIWMNPQIIATLEKAVKQIIVGKQTPYRMVDKITKMMSQRLRGKTK